MFFCDGQTRKVHPMIANSLTDSVCRQSASCRRVKSDIAFHAICGCWKGRIVKRSSGHLSQNVQKAEATIFTRPLRSQMWASAGMPSRFTSKAFIVHLVPVDVRINVGLNGKDSLRDRKHSQSFQKNFAKQSGFHSLAYNDKSKIVGQSKLAQKEHWFPLQLPSTTSKVQMAFNWRNCSNPTPCKNWLSHTPGVAAIALC